MGGCRLSYSSGVGPSSFQNPSFPSCCPYLKAVRGRYLEKVSITECPSLAHDPISYEDGDSCCHSFSLSQEKLKPQYLEQLPVQLKQFSLFLGKFSWFAGEKLTFVDFHIYEILDQNRIFEPKCLEEFPNLKAFMCRFEALEKIAAYMQSDRYFKMPIMNRMAYWGQKITC